MHLRLLDKYVLKELLYPFLFGVASFSSIFIASSMLFKIVKYITTYGASTSSVAKLFLYSMPEIINYTFPMSVLLATLMAFGKLSGSSEIVAMKSGKIFAHDETSHIIKEEILNPLYDMSIRIKEIDGKKFCLYF